MSGGAIAGMIVGILLLLCCAVLVLLYFMRKRKQTLSATVMLQGLKSSTRQLSAKLSSTKLLAVEEPAKPAEDTSRLHRI